MYQRSFREGVGTMPLWYVQVLVPACRADPPTANGTSVADRCLPLLHPCSWYCPGCRARPRTSPQRHRPVYDLEELRAAQVLPTHLGWSRTRSPLTTCLQVPPGSFPPWPYCRTVASVASNPVSAHSNAEPRLKFGVALSMPSTVASFASYPVSAHSNAEPRLKFGVVVSIQEPPGFLS
ncbi:hypothetical protein B0H15DRAFT_829729 [Mycena belliarum]|uniref:Uncharacterized protein n=1 Tax=Mycena belliarum TaxID=1033014 RepID=A0AAD6XRK2_9AGAR|nr:hypothetical protein B0H15DRAFT_829729 [Mycena belliae]